MNQPWIYMYSPSQSPLPLPSLGKLKKKKIKIIPVIFSDHSAVRLDLNYRKKNY